MLRALIPVRCASWSIVSSAATSPIARMLQVVITRVGIPCHIERWDADCLLTGTGGTRRCSELAALQQLSDVGEKACGFGAVQDPVIAGQRQGRHLARHDSRVADDWRVPDLT